MQRDAPVFQVHHQGLQRFQRGHVDFIHRRTHQDHMAQVLILGGALKDQIFQIAGVGEVKAFVDPQAKNRWVSDDFIAQDIAEMLGTGD